MTFVNFAATRVLARPAGTGRTAELKCGEVPDASVLQRKETQAVTRKETVLRCYNRSLGDATNSVTSVMTCFDFLNRMSRYWAFVTNTLSQLSFAA